MSFIVGGLVGESKFEAAADVIFAAVQDGSHFPVLHKEFEEDRDHVLECIGWTLSSFIGAFSGELVHHALQAGEGADGFATRAAGEFFSAGEDMVLDAGQLAEAGGMLAGATAVIHDEGLAADVAAAEDPVVANEPAVEGGFARGIPVTVALPEDGGDARAGKSGAVEVEGLVVHGRGVGRDDAGPADFRRRIFHG